MSEIKDFGEGWTGFYPTKFGINKFGNPMPSTVSLDGSFTVLQLKNILNELKRLTKELEKEEEK